MTPPTDPHNNPPIPIGVGWLGVGYPPLPPTHPPLHLPTDPPYTPPRMDVGVGGCRGGSVGRYKGGWVGVGAGG